MSKWFGSLPTLSRLAVTVIVFFGGVLLVGGGGGAMMGDPGTPEGHEFKKKWAPILFFFGCPMGFALIGLSLIMLIGCFRKPDPPA